MFPCIYRGGELWRAQCKTCPTLTMVKVFECVLKGQCTINNLVDNVAACSLCTSRPKESTT